jgi:tetratricopeptide (TPR) repeat protein
VIKLKKIISHLDEEICRNIEDSFLKSKADNFLFLFQSYRSDTKDAEIVKELNLNANSFYVLKSRLYDKIQEHLSGDIDISREDLLKKLNHISVMCVSEPREVVTAFLQKLEKDLLEYDMHNELLVVYGALKKLHLYSEKYFHYSQLYNKHIAFSLSLEKSEEILGSFNRTFGQYNFSRSPRSLETLLFIRKDIADHYALNPSRQVEIIRNLIELQLSIFCHTPLTGETNVEETLQKTRNLINELPESSPYKSWLFTLDFLAFEYYFKTGQTKQALTCFEKVDANLQCLLLYSNICSTSRFLISRIAFLQSQGRTKELQDNKSKITLFDSSDTHSIVLLAIYNAMISYYAGNYKEAANKLNETINETSFKDLFHISTDVKLTLAFIYMAMKDYDIADTIVKSIYRKIKSEKIDNYNNVLNLIKLFEHEIRLGGAKLTDKQRDDFTLFEARNTKESELLKHLLFELKKKYI